MIHAIKFLIKVALTVLLLIGSWSNIITTIVMWDVYYLDLDNESLRYLWTGKKKGETK